MEPTNNEIMSNNENSIGPVIAIIIVLALVILGGLYFWGQRKNVNDVTAPALSTSGSEEEMVAAIESQSSSNNPADIENDLNNTNVESLGAGLDAI